MVPIGTYINAIVTMIITNLCHYFSLLVNQHRFLEKLGFNADFDGKTADKKETFEKREK